MSTSVATHAVEPERTIARRAAIFAAALALTATTAFTGIQQANAQAATTATPPVVASQDQALSVADVAARANNAVVTIYTFVNASGQGALPGQGQSNANQPTPLGAGSGWIYSADGYVVTNNHVVEGADSFTVQYADGTQVEATLVGTDAITDVAVLKLDLKSGEKVPGVAEVGDSSQLRAGDQVVAIGSPLGEFTNTVSDGIIGGLNRSLDEGNGMTLGHLIQHDAEISPGNSGGPLLNMEGQVIGMNVAKVETTTSSGATASGLNFAIDGNTVKSVVETIVSTGASVEYPYLGVQIQEGDQGLVVMDVQTGSPADEAGLQRGDILTGIDGTMADATHPFMDLLMQHKPGDTVTVAIERAGQPQDLTVTLGTRPTQTTG